MRLKIKVELKRFGLILVLALIMIAVAACGSVDQEKRAGAVVENYYLALVDDNVIRMKNLSCSSWEEGAQLEYDAFVGVQMELPQISCQTSGQAGEEINVVCEGKILATYGNEQQVFDLSDVIYKVVQEGGDYRMCGH